MVEENTKIGGLGSAVLETLAGKVKIETFLHIALPDAFVEHGDLPSLRRKYGLDQEFIRDVIIKAIEGG